MANQYMIAAGHPLTAEAARHAFEQGGNAFDAALAGWLAACLAEPVLTSPGGGGFAMVAPANKRPVLLDFFAQTPRRPNPDGHTYPLEADFGSTRQVFHLGAGSIATPGCVAGIMQMHENWGRLPFSVCAEPARHYSRDGLTITSHAATLLTVVSDLYRASPEARQLFRSGCKENHCLLEGEIFHNPDFETFLDQLASEGTRWFYEGDIGRIVSEYCRDNEGHLTREDFLQYKVHIRDPLEIHHNGSRIWLNPAPSMGGTLIATALLSGKCFNGASYPFNSAIDWREWIRPIKLMSQIRSPEGIGELSEKDLATIQSALASCAALKDSFSELFPGAMNRIHSSGTTQISIMDKDGNEISMTTSNGAGSAIIPKGTGFMLNNMLGEEDLQPDGLNTWEPDSRLASMMAPTIARLPGGIRIATGSGGSNRIRSTLLQILRLLTEFHEELEGAVNAPRLHWEDGFLHAESGAAAVLRNMVNSQQHQLIEHPVPNLFFGGAHSVAWQPKGSFKGVGDDRRGGVALGA